MNNKITKRKEPTKETVIKFLLILIPLIVLQYVIYSNFFASHDFSYFYDIGSEKDNFLSPTQRVSSSGTENSVTYRNLTSNLVYFNVPVTKGSESINILIKFKDNFPESGNLIIGAKNQTEWNYKSYTAYNKTIESMFEKYPSKSEGSLILFKLNPKAKDYSVSDFLKDPQARTSTDQNITILDLKIQNYTPKDFTIDTALRGSQTMYVYAKDNISVTVYKRDLNWYDNEDSGNDTLQINLFDLNGNLIKTSIIKDDGIDEAKINKSNTKDQSGTLTAYNLKEGVYKLELKNNADMLITKIRLNQNKIVLYKEVFLAQSSVYFNKFEKTSKIYFKAPKTAEVSAQSWHAYGLNQTIRINEYSIEMEEKTAVKYYTRVPSSENFYEVTANKNDVLISGPSFFAFSKDSWFDLSQFDTKFNQNNFDYALVDYNPAKELGEWRTSLVTFNVSDLYIQDGKANILINIPHLAREDFKQNVVPIDWINITVHKTGFVEEWNN